MRDASRTREQIEKQAMRLFVEKGVAEASIRDVAQAAGVSDGALYRHFTGSRRLDGPCWCIPDRSMAGE